MVAGSFNSCYVRFFCVLQFACSFYVWRCVGRVCCLLVGLVVVGVVTV